MTSTPGVQPDVTLVIDLRESAAELRRNEQLIDLSLECLFCGRHYVTDRAVARCEAGHYWSVVAQVAAREHQDHVRAALAAAKARGQLDPALEPLLRS